MEKITIYKIKRFDGMFSKGGSNPSFDSKGKSWYKIGHLKNHLHQVECKDYIDCEVVKYEYLLSNEDVINDINPYTFKNALQEAKKNRYEQISKNREMEEMRRLMDKYKII